MKNPDCGSFWDHKSYDDFNVLMYLVLKIYLKSKSLESKIIFVILLPNVLGVPYHLPVVYGASSYKVAMKFQRRHYTFNCEIPTLYVQL